MKPPFTGLIRQTRLQWAKLPSFRLGRLPDAPRHAVRDPWPGDAGRGARLLRGEMEYLGAVVPFGEGMFADTAAPALMREAAHGFAFLRDLRALGTDGARMRARAALEEWVEAAADPIAERPDVVGARIAAWLGHYDFFAASADDAFRQTLMARIVGDARALVAALPTEETDGRALTALKGAIAAAVALPDQGGFLARAMRVLPPEIERQVRADGGHCERSPARHLAALQDLVEIRALLQAAQLAQPAQLTPAIERLAAGLRTLRHPDGGLALFNGTREESAVLVDMVLTQAGRTGRNAGSLIESGFHRLQAGRSMLLIDAGAPPPPRLDRFSHAGTLSFELSVGRERLIVNCGAAPSAENAWRNACRTSAAHSTLTMADTSSSELRPEGLGRRPEHVEAQRQEADGAFWLDASHDGWMKPFRAVHRRRLYMAGSGEDIRGEDAVEAAAAQPYAVRFHLHPEVSVNLQQDGEAVLLRLASGGGWRLRRARPRGTPGGGGVRGGPAAPRPPHRGGTGYQDGPQTVKWALTKVA